MPPHLPTITRDGGQQGRAALTASPISHDSLRGAEAPPCPDLTQIKRP